MLNHKPENNQVKRDFHFKLLSLFNANSQGFSLVTGVALGALMVGATGLAIASASRNQINVTANEQSAQAQAAAEAGVTQIQNFLAQNPSLALVDWSDKKTPEQIQTEIVSLLPTNSCNGTGSGNTTGSGGTGGVLLSNAEIAQIEKFTNKEWQSLGSKTGFRLVSIQRGVLETKKPAKVTIQGRSTDNSTAQIMVDMPIKVVPANNSAPVPALWISDNGNDFKSDKVNGDIKIASCNQLNDISGAPTTENLASDTQRLYADPEPIPDTPPLPDASVLNIFTGQSVAGKTFPIDTPAIPAVAAIPAVPATTVTKKDCLELKNNGSCKTFGPSYTETIQGTPAIPAQPEIPAQSAKQDAKGVYHYLIDDLDLSGGSNLNIQEGAKVVLYVRGNIKLSGNPDINPNANNSSKNLQIYGNTYTGTNTTKYGCGSLTVGTNCPTLQAHFNGTGTMKAFVHAPDAVGSVNGGGSTNGNFRGSIWIKAWDSSSGNDKVKIDSFGTYGDYLGASQRTPKPQLSSITNWDRQAVTP